MRLLLLALSDVDSLHGGRYWPVDDEVEGPETQHDTWHQRGAEVGHPNPEEVVVTHEDPYLARQLSRFFIAGK